MSDQTDSRMVAFLKEHPRMMGALFTLLVLLSQAGTVIAEEGSATSGYPGP